GRCLDVCGARFERGGESPLRLLLPPWQSVTHSRGRHSLFSATVTSTPWPFTLAHGTTTLAFTFQGGVIAAADTRASCAGLVAYCVLWERVLAREIRLYQLRHGRRLSVSGAGKLLALMLHPFKGTEVCVAATLCGWDEGDEPGPRVCYVCSDGLRLNGELISVGSGSPYAYSVLDAGWRWSMTVNEAVALAREAVYRATHRDAYSGNNVDLFHITARGWKCRRREDLKEEYYKENRRGKEMM
uniref:Proteasome subunit beta n=1 Tax=Electrophorus electricus TaxID=8005 RepID=A0A4W4GWW7_ELEEL